jgi:superfamily II DNA or RNA helicase
VTKAIIDSSIRVPLDGLPPGAAEEIRKTLTVWDKDREDAVERGDYGAEDAPEWIELWRHEGPDLVLPRGFRIPLERGLADLGHRIEWDDRTSRAPVDFWYGVQAKGPTLKPEQERLVQELTAHGGGILQAPPGAGKTVMILELWRRLGMRGLILVEKGHLVRQWMERARQHLGYEPGFIGDGQWEERDLTIAMLQTLYRRGDEIDDDWFSFWGLMVADEVHHGQAPSYRSVIARSRSSFLAGVTATPLEQDWRQPILTSLVGPIVTRSAHREMEPTIVPVRTGFRWAPTEVIKNPGKYYQKLLVALAQDNLRNEVIARMITAQPESCAQLVLSRRLKHLELLRALIISLDRSYMHKVFMLRGSESLDEREEVQARAAEGGCVILSTIAGEGFDAPRLDRLHLPWPQKSNLAITQQVGRVLRSHDGKLDPVVFDYVDDPPVLRKQWMERLHGTYVPSGWSIDHQRMAA